MTKPATTEDLLDLRTARIAKGYLLHRNCGGKIVWSMLTDKAKCTLCDWHIHRPALTKIDHGPYKRPDLGIDRID